MKILQINTVISYGSTGIICQNIARGLIANGHDCLTVYGRGDDVEDIPTKKIGNKFEQGLHYLRSHFLDQHGLGSRFATRQLIQIIRDYQPDVIHLHNIHGYYVNYRILFEELRALAIPVVWLLHDQWAISGGAAYIENNIRIVDGKPIKIVRTQEEKKQYPSVARISFSRFEQNIRDKYQVITAMTNLTLVTPSCWLTRFVEDSFLKKFQVLTIYNGMDTRQFSVDLPSKTEKINILGAASVWDERKGLKYFCQLAEDLGDNFQITLIGVDDSTSLPSNIIKVGRLNSSQMVHYYNQADVFVNPTLRDNFPTVNIEAQLCGTPVITFDTGGAKEAICTQTGKIVVQGDYEQLFVAITSMIPKNKYIATKTREHALAFSVENMVNDYIKLYQEVVVCKL
ncbi:TPA: glycosyltransferase [Streptococcus suis]|uniref:glycosyltransferase n=1 Tax=Streptococcus suis TaxID=1307 RepID=UPI0003F8D37F|nr:glycosyltransferase [Streptococcus suis]MDY7595150.1 glycosyltransferase [Streptococcus suis]MEE3746417.1 glycosyltransferase [Streptococcus suis]NQN11503.1 glycosyltransferase [Streptococcus suis]NQR43887.1 glycosyltransferase [Streptococcus suis]WNF77145.1 glycosyltransferase [Streptococcus suis]